MDSLILWLVISIILLIGLPVWYFLSARRIRPGADTEEPKREIWLCVMLAGLVVRVIAAVTVYGYGTDIGLFRAWAEEAARDLPRVYSSGVYLDYPPLYLYILYFIGKLGSLFPEGMPLILLKAPPIICDLAAAELLRRFAKEKLGGGTALLLASLFVLNPAVFVDSAMWGQVDSVFLVLLIGALWFLERDKLHFASVMLALLVLMKPQGVMFLPLLLYAILRKPTMGRVWASIWPAALVTMGLTLPFDQEPFWIFKLLFSTGDYYRYASFNAFNLYSLVGANLARDDGMFLFLSYNVWGIVFGAALFIAAGVFYLKRREEGSFTLAACALAFGVFMLLPRMHERYIYPVVALMLASYIYTEKKAFLYMYFGVSVTAFINIYHVLYRQMRTDYVHVSPDNPVLLAVSAVNLLIFAYMLAEMVMVVRQNSGSLKRKKKALKGMAGSDYE